MIESLRCLLQIIMSRPGFAAVMGCVVGSIITAMTMNKFVAVVFGIMIGLATGIVLIMVADRMDGATKRTK